MIPLRDSTRSRSFPIITVLLIIVNLYIYFQQAAMMLVQEDLFLRQYALVPAFLTERLQSSFWSAVLYPPLVTSLFLHGGWFHVIFNMLYLWIFGDNIEDNLGHVRFLVFYLLCGIIANLSHVLIDPLSPVPLVGASGAIAGVLGAYIITFPRSRITSLLVIFIFITIRDIPAVYFLLFWFILQLFNGLTSIGLMSNSVAWWAHIGGFLSGMILMLIMKKKNRWDTYP